MGHLQVAYQLDEESSSKRKQGISLAMCNGLPASVSKHGEVTPLSSGTPRARQKNLFFLSCITKVDQNYINFFHE